jgi:CheY-like chemotaxis protein
MKRTALIIDDDINGLSAVGRVLASDGFLIATALSAELAWELLEKETFDAVVCDEQLPGMQGSEFLALVAERCPHAVRVLVSGQAKVIEREQFVGDATRFRFLQKPCSAEALRQILEEPRLSRLSRLSRRSAEAALTDMSTSSQLRITNDHSRLGQPTFRDPHTGEPVQATDDRAETAGAGAGVEAPAPDSAERVARKAAKSEPPANDDKARADSPANTDTSDKQSEDSTDGLSRATETLLRGALDFGERVRKSGTMKSFSGSLRRASGKMRRIVRTIREPEPPPRKGPRGKDSVPPR